MAALGGDGLRLLSVSRPERPPESAALGGPGPGLCCWVSVFSCLSLACSYVGSLYVWKSELPRDHPAVIKRRFTSVLVVSSLSPLCVLLWRELTGIQPGTSLLTLMGFRLEGIFPAALLPLLLTMILFLGPLMQLSMDCSCDLADGLKVVLAPRSWARCLTDMRWLRNQVIAPLTEELVFRACMLPMLAPCTGLGPAVFTCPLFFGVAHFHHIFEQLRFRQSSVGSIFLSAAFQFSYTAVFGAYTAFLFIRTGGPFALCLPQKVCQPHLTQEETNLRWKRNRLGHLGVEAFLALSTSDRCHDATSLVPGGTQPKGSEHEQPCHATLELKVFF
uniref:CAAX prenyl protease 2 n=1 Tax=Sus scrofa TaxID=9823 RepID=A0A8D1V5B2_PIG